MSPAKETSGVAQFRITPNKSSWLRGLTRPAELELYDCIEYIAAVGGNLPCGTIPPSSPFSPFSIQKAAGPVTHWIGSIARDHRAGKARRENQLLGFPQAEKDLAWM
ncbi:hypothetical protein Salat_0654300 [Sesamum alatum]|uniref:Uncharacterized protein n=1 Tax=Sesamum alatum TaxID=300844 RepID=A0AAE2CUT5_9LAMI|nr:hypothetical protein Salat_0654300 [Sesamum alatum]